jgi:CelD/BcsL family acetyltransferase involved in cellulose biosynthesis
VIEAELLVDASSVGAIAEEWDELAVANAMPSAAPAWVMAWWRHVAPAGAQPRVIGVRDDGRLVGVLPFHTTPVRRRPVEYRLMAGDFGVAMSPLAVPGREWEVAREAGRVLAASPLRPDILDLGPMPLASHWLPALREQWPGLLRGSFRGPAYRYAIEGSPLILLRQPSFDEWLASLSSNLRKNLRRRWRLFEREGGTLRISTAATLRSDAEAFARLHRARWQGRGLSRLVALGDRLVDLLVDVGSELLDAGRFSLLVLEIDGEPIAIDLSLEAGGTVTTVNAGWDERFARLSPSQLTLLRLVEECYRRGARRLDLGIVAYPYKLAFADGNEPVAWSVFLPPARGLARAYPVILRKRVRDAAAGALPEEQFAKVMLLRRRIAS